jgi:DNA adenine methylase
MSRHWTPLRYPGGKQRLTPFILEVLIANDLVGGEYVEPYAGGAGVAMELLIRNYVRHVHLNDVSYPIYAFWRSVLTQTDELCRLISTASLTVEEWRRRQYIVQNPGDFDDLQVGFSTFYLNRCNHSGVLSGGLIGGIEQDGNYTMSARFTRNELVRRIQVIAARSNAISLRRMDAEDFIRTYIPDLPGETLVYCDPPYFGLKSRLYLNRYTASDHQRIADVIQQQLYRKWVVSYDGTNEIQSYYAQRRKFLYDLKYNAARVYTGTEVFIFSDDVIIPRRSTLPYIHVPLQEHTDVLHNRPNTAARANLPR